ncbi:hypothetical protein [uncultured Pontibacter sp.]|uniref:hypothetical protein n=1 Tax=uncultured Pontibacter sp. TaxID=453356 RepID=UPI00261250C9|nr:hypothetical protein [uncultured Pontibacter sp.]
MKTIATLFLLTFLPLAAFSQDFSKSLAEAKTSYTSGDLSSSRFAMEQMLRSLDAEIGKEILKMLPVKMEDRSPNLKEDDVTGGGSGMGMGLFVHRSYGPASNQVTVDIINNSPLINSLQAVLALPFIGNSGDGSQKVVKVQGYKAVLNKVEGMEGTPSGYELQIPLQNTLLTLTADNAKEDSILKMANSLPLDKIAQMAH